jgi:ARG and Rhodanese-Phosphatase-superfamily-associated Protein domain
MQKLWLGGVLMAALIALFMPPAPAGVTGEPAPIVSDYKLLDPITHGDLTIFPVVSAKTHDTNGFLTLDEGIRSGEVVVTEAGNLHSAMQRRPVPQTYRGSAQVNSLVLVNNSQRPLILLAGEIVTGGKQDRVVAKDRIVPSESDPVDLGVFCVEPHRWVETSSKFDTHASVMAQPSVRKKAMAEKDQQQVWDEVGRAKSSMTMSVAAAPPAARAGSGSGTGSGVGVGSGAGSGIYVSDSAYVDAYTRELNGTSSYAKARENAGVQKQVEAITQPMQQSYESLIKQLRNQNAVGVVVAVKGRIVWADLFASTALLNKYWPKLLQSYAAEALTTTGDHREVSAKDAQQFLDNWQANHETVDSEPGLYRQRELVGDRFRAFELTSLLPKAAFDVHLSKMAD